MRFVSCASLRKKSRSRLRCGTRRKSNETGLSRCSFLVVASTLRQTELVSLEPVGKESTVKYF